MIVYKDYIEYDLAENCQEFFGFKCQAKKIIHISRDWKIFKDQIVSGIQIYTICHKRTVKYIF